MAILTREGALPLWGEHAVRPLFERFPRLIDTVPCLPLAALPTQVQRLRELGMRTGARDIWIKRDDLSGNLYGGNKPRKLEFYLAQARLAGARRVVTFGALGTHHGLATAIYGRELGMQVRLVLKDQPLNDDVRAQLLFLHQLGVELIRIPSAGGFIREMVRQTLRPDPWTYAIPAGGSSAVGALGFVNAALELAQQVREGQLPVPRYIFVPAGTGGTMAGLEVGLRLAGLPTRVVGVRVNDRIFCNPWIVSGLAKRTAQFLRNAGARLPRLSISAMQVRLLDGYLGRGYGKTTPEGERAMELLRETEGLDLDPTYSAKALAAMLDAIEREGLQREPVLFWHTFNSRPLLAESPPIEAYRELPRSFHPLFA